MGWKTIKTYRTSDKPGGKKRRNFLKKRRSKKVVFLQKRHNFQRPEIISVNGPASENKITHQWKIVDIFNLLFVDNQ